jgi:spore maturation protein CgeB
MSSTPPSADETPVEPRRQRSALTRPTQRQRVYARGCGVRPCSPDGAVAPSSRPNSVRIAVVGADEKGSLARSFVDGARALGHEAYPVFADAVIAGRRPLFLARRLRLDGAVGAPILWDLERRLARVRPELVLVVKGRFIDASSVRRMRARLKCPILNYYPDDPLWPGHDDRRLLVALEFYDEVIVWADRVAEGLAARGVNARVVPFGYDPKGYVPKNHNGEREFDAILVGQRYEEREEFVAALTDIRLLVSGTGWDAARHDVVRQIASTRTYSGAEISRLYARSAFGLNFLSPWNLGSHNMRTFEIPATGTAMVATWTPDHERLFGDDGAILVRSPEEARARILEMLGNEAEIRRVGERGRERIAAFTYARRMAEVLAPWDGNH